MLTISNLSYHINKRCLLSVDSLQINSGEFVSVLGANGAGKSTLLKSISGDIKTQGSITFHNQTMSQWPIKKRARHLAFLPQQSQLSFPFTAYEVVALGLTPLSMNRHEQITTIKKAMEKTQCSHLMQQPYPQLSGGEKQRVQFARVLVQLSQAEQPPLLLLDEPTAAQDLGQQHALLSLCQDLCQQHHYAIVAILHDLNHAMHYSDQSILLKQGKVTHKDAPEKLLNEEIIFSHWDYKATISHDEKSFIF